MRHTALIASTACAALLALSAPGPARAQQEPPAPPPAVTAPAPATTPVDVAPAPTPPPATALDQNLVIPAPPGMAVQVEMDLHDDDLLGVFKSLLRGVGQAAEGARKATASKPASAQTTHDADIAAILNNADLSDVLKDVTHIHFVLYETPSATGRPGVRAAVKPRPAPAVATLPADPMALYENAFATEGGRRIIFVNAEPVHVIMTTFGKGRGFAFTVQSPESVGVLRADGYPDLSKLAALATSVGAAAGKSVFDEAMKPDTPKH